MPTPAAVPAQSFSSVWAKGRIQLFRYLAILRRRWWVVFLTVSLSLCGAAYYVSQMPPAYRSEGQLMVSGQLRLTEGAAYSEELVNFFGTQVALMQSAEVQVRAKARVAALHPELRHEKVKLEVGQLPRASIFIMRTEGESPLYTQAYLDACMAEYVATKKEMRSQKSESTTVAIQDELVRLEKEMETDGDKLHEFQKENNIGFLHEEGNSAGLYLAQLNRQIADLKTEYDLLSLLNLDQNLDREKTPVPSATGSASVRDTTLANYGPMAEYQKARQQLQMLKAEREDFSRYLRPRHPTIVALDEQITRGEKLIDAFRTQSVETLKTRRESIGLQIKNLESVIQQWSDKALELSRRVAEFDRIKAKGERTKGQYDRLLANLRSVDVTKNVDQDTVSILAKASPARWEKPAARYMWAGGAAGLLLGLMILFIIDKLDDRIGSFMEFGAHYPEHILGQIPSEDMSGDLALLKHSDARHSLLESYRTLRSSLLFLPVDGARPKTLLITSAAPGEGKTTVASNLAIILAFSGAKVLLVDADIRRGRLHGLFGTPPDSAGFSKVLRQRIPWAEAVIKTNIENLSVLPRGKSIPHPAEHFLGKVTDQFLQDVYDQYDYILFDSAPVLVADDTLSLAPKIDGIIFVVRFAQSSARMGRRALDLLSHRQVNVLGLVCNDVHLSEAEYGYGSYYQYAELQKPAARRAG